MTKLGLDLFPARLDSHLELVFMTGSAGLRLEGGEPEPVSGSPGPVPALHDAVDSQGVHRQSEHTAADQRGQHAPSLP